MHIVRIWSGKDQINVPVHGHMDEKGQIYGTIVLVLLGRTSEVKATLKS